MTRCLLRCRLRVPAFSAGCFPACCLLALTLAFVPVSALAAKSGLVVTPLDEGARETPSTPGGGPASANGPTGTSQSPVPGNGGATATSQGAAPGMNPETDGSLMQSFPEQPSYKDGIVMAYLVELMRKQNRPCPSGATPPVPPSLLFSEPLCRVAEAVAKGAAFPEAYEEQGIYAARWRMFSAADLPAQTVATRLRAEHCEALLEPYTHIGAWHSAAGWRIVLATLTDKPQPDLVVNPGEAASGDHAPVPVPPVAPAVPGTPETVQPEAAAQPTPGEVPVVPTVPAAAAAAVVSAPQAASVPVPEPAPVPVAPPAPATPEPVLAVPAPDAYVAPAASSGSVPVPVAALAVPAPGVAGQEARALFTLVNELRAKGGSCLGQPARTAPPLVFSQTLQTIAEREAAEAAAKGAFGSILGGGQPSGTAEYPGVKVSRLTAGSRAPVSAVLDVWMVNPTRCDALLSTDYVDAGAAYVDGYWAVLLGQCVENSPPKKTP